MGAWSSDFIADPPRATIFDTPEVNDPAEVESEMKTLLDQLTVENFEPLSDQMIVWANNSDDEKNTASVVRLIFERASDEAEHSNVYTRLFRKMMENISSEALDDLIRDPAGQPILDPLLEAKQVHKAELETETIVYVLDQVHCSLPLFIV